MESLKRLRSDSDYEFEAKRIQHDLLDTLEDTDEYTVGEDLESVIKTFEDEISPPPATSESRPNLEFLLEASDDELGLPPPTESERMQDSTESGVFSWLDDQVPNFDSFDYVDGDADNGEDLELGGLFENTDVGFGSSDLARQPESLPAQ